MEATTEIPIEEVTHAAADPTSLYRTQWLMAHNRLHAAVHDPKASLPEVWSGYLADLATAEVVASSPA
jgi:hypothetical protein